MAPFMLGPHGVEGTEGLTGQMLATSCPLVELLTRYHRVAPAPNPVAIYRVSQGQATCASLRQNEPPW